MTRKIAAFAALSVVGIALVASACGGKENESHARALYRAYRVEEDSRTDAEERLRQAFSDISSSAQSDDREAVLAAARRGQDAVGEIDDLLSAELEAAAGLAEIDSVTTHAEELSDGLQLSRESLALVAKELEVALDDPFLATRKKEVDDLAQESTHLAVKGELAVRRADHALALALGIEPRPDRIFMTTTG